MATIFEVFTRILDEREYQDSKWGYLDATDRSISDYLLIMRKELGEAENGWIKNLEGRDSALSEILQVAAVAVACLQKYT
jgi:hypothetical protein